MSVGKGEVGYESSWERWEVLEGTLVEREQCVSGKSGLA